MNLTKKILYSPSIILEKLSDHCTRKAQDLEFCDGFIMCAPQNYSTVGVLYEIAGIALSYLAHPFFGKRITKPNIPNLSWDR